MGGWWKLIITTAALWCVSIICFHFVFIGFNYSTNSIMLPLLCEKWQISVPTAPECLIYMFILLVCDQVRHSSDSADLCVGWRSSSEQPDSVMTGLTACVFTKYDIDSMTFVRVRGKLNTHRTSIITMRMFTCIYSSNSGSRSFHVQYALLLNIQTGLTTYIWFCGPCFELMIFLKRNIKLHATPVYELHRRCRHILSTYLTAMKRKLQDYFC